MEMTPTSPTSRVNLLASSVLILFTFFVPATVFAQSTDQLNPTPITTNQINGQITARDVGDSRRTSYYYLFTGNRGDVFINVVTRNINGSIDIFTLNGLSPKTKITLFADNPDGETGRIVYMRESEILILRIQGKTPNDEPGTFQIKFAGSFAPVAGIANSDGEPEVGGNTTGAVRVNSVGTIIAEAAPPKVDVPQTEDAEKIAVNATVDDPADAGAGKEDPAERPEALETPATAVAEGKRAVNTQKAPTVIVEDPFGEGKTDALNTEVPARKEVTVSITDSKPERSALVTITRNREEEPPAAEATLEERLARVQLRVTLKSGGSFIRPMNEVLSVNVIRGVLTIVTNDGRIQEFSILDVEKMSIE